jgi:hypothetical protein
MTPTDEDPSVLGNLPRTRPQRRSGRRAGEAATGRRSSAPTAKPRSATRTTPGSAPAAQSRSAPAAQARATSPPIVADAIAAAGEVSKLGLTLGVKVLRGAVSRLPRPR